MTAYMIIEPTIRDPVVYDQYLVQVPATLEKFGGRYLARGGRITPLSPAWNPGRIVLLEFPAEEDIRAWLDSAGTGRLPRGARRGRTRGRSS
jgi:uncharacterized protein (DUF1330 family)